MNSNIKIYEKKNIEELLLKLYMIRSSLFVNDFKIQPYIDKLTPKEHDILSAFDSLDLWKNLSLDELSDRLSKCLAELEKLPQITITLAVEPSLSLIDYIKDYFTDSVNTAYVLEFKSDVSIYGGVLIENAGQYRDFSIKKLVKENLKFYDL